MTPAIVEVTWRDAVLRHKSMPLSQAVPHAFVRRTVGYLIKRTKTDLLLSVTFDPSEPGDVEPEVDELFTIPAVWVVEIATLRRGNSKHTRRRK